MDTKEEILRLVKESNPANPIQFVNDIVKGFAREKLDEYIEDCNACEYCSGIKSLTRGNPNASVMIIGEYPSQEQAKDTGLNGDIVYPLMDTGGERLDQILEYLNINKEEVFYMNIFNCFPFKDAESFAVKTPLKAEIKECSVYIDYAIKMVQPLVIILLGNIALNAFYKESISKARGTWIEAKGIPAMPTYHPNYFDKITGKMDEETVELFKWEFYNDIKNVFLYLNKEYPDNNICLGEIPKD